MSLRRREFVAALGGAAGWPLVARAQQAAMPVIGFLHNAAPEATQYYLPAFHKGLGEAGFVEGRNVAIEFRWARMCERDGPVMSFCKRAFHRNAAILPRTNQSASPNFLLPRTQGNTAVLRHRT
jgi:putative ABC transport system substrate-binding protein